jgi:hypothetical protein
MRFWQIAVVLSGCVVNGKAYGPGGSSTPSSPSGAGAPSGGTAASSATTAGSTSDASGQQGAPASNDRSDLYTPDGRVREDARYYKEPPYLSAPADPWAAVQGEYPLRWTEAAAEHWTLRGNESPCTAMQDHCLVKDAWFFVKQSDIDSKVDRPMMQISAMVGVFGPTKPAIAWNARPSVNGDNLIAYRTVPATKHNLVPGAIVIGLGRERWPHSAIGAYEAMWYYGEVEEVQIDLGVYKLKGGNDTLPLEGARVAVLVFKENTKVKILGSKKRDQLAVKPSDLFLPPKN